MSTTHLFRSLALLLAAAVFAVGCDGFESGTPPDEAGVATPPTVEFATGNAGAIPSDSIVTVDIQLQNPDGNEVTVEVLFAGEASSAALEDLANSVDPVTEVSFAATTGETVTRSVEIDVSDADISQGRKEAKFALQNLQTTGRATLGETSQFTLNIGFPPLADLRADGAGASGIFEAIVTEVSGSDVRVQDETAGILISRNDEFASAVEDGDEVRISGTVSSFANQLQIDEPGDLDDFEVLSSGNDLPDAQTITLAEVAADPDAFESERVRVEGITIDPDGDSAFQAGGSAGNYTVTDGEGNTLTLRIPGASFYGGEPIPTGPITFEGVLGQFFDDVQLRARYEGDIIVQ
jgi:hypothetical protein